VNFKFRTHCSHPFRRLPSLHADGSSFVSSSSSSSSFSSKMMVILKTSFFGLLRDDSEESEESEELESDSESDFLWVAFKTFNKSRGAAFFSTVFTVDRFASISGD
jgi:hypothetical protein